MSATKTYAARDASKSYPTIKLTYFPLTGRAEAVRQAFYVGGVPFEDERIAFQDWGARKASTPFGQLPVLEVDGQQIAQSYAILIYAGQMSGLYPSDAWDAAKVNEVLFLLEDINKDAMNGYREEDAEKKAAIKQKYVDDLIAKHLPNFEKVLNQNNEGKGYLVGGKLTIADLATVALFRWFFEGMPSVPASVLDKFPAIVAYRERIEAEPLVKEYNDQSKQ